jgi:hypothetical protein
MPLYDYACPNGHIEEHYLRADERDAVTPICPKDGHTMGPVASFGMGLVYFEEGRPRVIENLGHEPVVVRSAREHERAMKQAGVTWATAGRGRKGSWV